ncbi:4-hydroxysphinganine ceramide fatty acyl 2-hydroxylase [Marchantia polymorpha subsp. ruderalis]|uniref:Fatty acid 2-hydroxylase n=1 Tax=Marchantia polymorpha TaxID=3197 RepID=A0A2R6X9D5_MARPO|nr:hypothetical protein MARPO_0028s0041 [Marchantia polymorpha]BBN00675.1 hypothetical protein Mp_2g01100 [Marchantia polymorpha subsp. ruderalis]|eukprot:PTQ42721.1 hypothetical protein MARPO_0028s0041 [Marchantia polymorpha]
MAAVERLDASDGDETRPSSPDSVLDPQLEGSLETNFRRRKVSNGLTGSAPALKVVTLEEVRNHRTPADAWIVVDGEVYDITDFLANHPGGSELIMEHLEDDNVHDIMQGTDKASDHSHSKSAYEMLEQFHVGSLPSKVAKTAPACKTTFKSSNGFVLDLKKPLVLQVGYLGEDYHDWVHQAIVTKETPFFFGNKFLEFNTRTVWWVVPLIWLPVICWLEYMATRRGLSIYGMLPATGAGILFWSFVEYSLHRHLFHVKTTTYWWNTLHYLLHGCHHKYPLDGLRLVFPPAGTTIFCVLFWNILKNVISKAVMPAAFGGGLLGYVMYDLTHYFLHHGVPFDNISRNLKRYHLNHHFKEQTTGFGITSSLWDWVFGTLPPTKG